MNQMNQLMSKLLEGIVVIDLSSRLPGPYAGYLLEKMGASVLKIENTRYPDAFSDKSLHQLDPIFKLWYQRINENKTRISLDFESFEDQKKLQSELRKAHIILAPRSKKVIEICGLEEISKLCPVSIIQIGGGKTNRSMHDLNALALTEAFSMHTGQSDSPPFLPIAGISYGQQIASEALACHLKALRSNSSIWHEVFLDESTLMQFSPFASSETIKTAKHLHTGLFPCYNIYSTSDGGKIAVAAVEEHFWDIFTKSFELSLTADDRYDTSKKVFELIKSKIASLTTKEAKLRIKGHDSCVTVIGPLSSQKEKL